MNNQEKINFDLSIEINYIPDQDLFEQITTVSEFASKMPVEFKLDLIEAAMHSLFQFANSDEEVMENLNARLGDKNLTTLFSSKETTQH